MFLDCFEEIVSSYFILLSVIELFCNHLNLKVTTGETMLDLTTNLDTNLTTTQFQVDFLTSYNKHNQFPYTAPGKVNIASE